MDQTINNEEYIYGDDGEQIPVKKRRMLNNMKSVMHRDNDERLYVAELVKTVERLTQTHNSLLRETQTLRKRNTLFENRTKTLENRISGLERDIAMMARAMHEVSNTLDKMEETGIMSRNRRK